ncbi:hypothetical protein [Amycolatopsis sp. PS_44_ISF1]|uniref:hypothetical protein n=1 Tax=Amycolatopsis sp. PS_44_ISF1 TaxID=2974917 RepID=UPI0028DF2747|nr:hypothetical protein [Amycolatopsis sp. PS_44_ISF1]MDT8913244.1 hypothetical protein [Amycolatopsis sp. PS_44_ISF1]
MSGRRFGAVVVCGLLAVLVAAPAGPVWAVGAREAGEQQVGSQRSTAHQGVRAWPNSAELAARQDVRAWEADAGPVAAQGARARKADAGLVAARGARAREADAGLVAGQGVRARPVAVPGAGEAPAGRPGTADQPAAAANSQWLARQLSAEGTLQNPLGGALPDHGLMIDSVFAMYASGRGELAAPITSYLEKHATDYYTWDGLVHGQGYDAVITGGAAAKVLVAAEVAGRDPRNFGGHDMVAETLGAIPRQGRDRGRVSDYSKDPALASGVSNNSNTFGQALGVIGLARVHENDQPAIDTLVNQQCSEGYFRIFFGYLPTGGTGADAYRLSSCDEGKATGESAKDGDTTGLSLSAMLAARDAGATGLDARIGRTVAWLEADQDPGGGWGGGVGTEAPNTNSTGLIVQALADAGGADAAVAKGVAFLKAAQVTAAADPGDRLQDQIGAIAYTPSEYTKAKPDGIGSLDTWIRASAQASLGLSQIGFYALTGGVLPVKPVPPPSPGAKPGEDHQAVPPTAGGSPSRPPETSFAAGSPGPAPQSPAGRLGAYLAGRLAGGDHVETTQDGRTYVDYDLTADLVLALRTLGGPLEAADRASRFLLSPDSINAYAHGAPYEPSSAAYVEPLAKLQIIAQFLAGGEDAPAGLRSTITQLHTALTALRGGDGEFADTGRFADPTRTTRRQAWGVLAATAVSDTTGARSGLDFLLGHQCRDGLFPVAVNAGPCATGDAASTSAVVQALVVRARPPAAGPVPGLVPGDWSRDRAAVLESAAGALSARPDRAGLIEANGAPDPVLSSLVAGARQAAGLDVAATVRSVGALQGGDGGLPKTPGGPSDLATSVASAAGIAGRGWTGADGSPVTPAVRLPFTSGAAVAAPKAAQASAGGRSPGLLISLLALGLLLSAAVLAGQHHFTRRTRRITEKMTNTLGSTQ